MCTENWKIGLELFYWSIRGVEWTYLSPTQRGSVETETWEYCEAMIRDGGQHPVGTHKGRNQYLCPPSFFLHGISLFKFKSKARYPPGYKEDLENKQELSIYSMRHLNFQWKSNVLFFHIFPIRLIPPSPLICQIFFGSNLILLPPLSCFIYLSPSRSTLSAILSTIETVFNEGLQYFFKSIFFWTVFTPNCTGLSHNIWQFLPSLLISPSLFSSFSFWF